MPEHRRALIIGASRGIGLGLVNAHLEAGWEVHATTRHGNAANSDPGVTWHRLEVRDRDQLDVMVAGLPRLDRIVHNAGVLRAPRAELMEVNTKAPIRIVQALLDAALLSWDGQVAIMTSQMGSRRGRTGSLGDYGDSKAALNDEFRARADEWRRLGAIAIVIHPGWVRTDMGGPGASISIDQSVRGTMRLLDGLTAADHGSFLTWDGRVHPW
ncbi:MAG TPA: SDR family NAD(P)-dependent oxidoreductase [Acidimicrobiia bacterium]|nr:SDR family NAD(P)-dependent oxidoreductase [Acidimicrobiia bacterium]